MRTRRVEFISMIVLVVAVAACSEPSDVPADNAGSQRSGDSVPGRAAACMPLETREPNAPDQRPAFPGQTRACAIQSNVAFDVGALAKGLENPWAVEPLPGGDLLVTEKPGRLRIVSATGELGQPIASPIGQDVDVDSAGVHLCQALGAEFEETLADKRRPRRAVVHRLYETHQGGIRGISRSGGEKVEMLLNGDLRQRASAEACRRLGARIRLDLTVAASIFDIRSAIDHIIDNRIDCRTSKIEDSHCY